LAQDHPTAAQADADSVVDGKEAVIGLPIQAIFKHWQKRGFLLLRIPSR